MKKISFFFLIMLLVFPFNVKATTEVIDTKNPPTNLELSFLRFLGPTILTVMAEHGDRQLFTDERILKIARNIEQDYYDVSLKVIGYKGAMNPAYKMITMTIRTPSGDHTNKPYKVIHYQSKLITP
ncbi:DUF3888 domain-containing protein [Bacillus sp. 1P06AnD]|uniref:DUF3888 domain-containing protein n=1 Tax=Bacillus sp. 1P06AnD TaxID=3132208 RepID=UPI0039A2B9EA